MARTPRNGAPSSSSRQQQRENTAVSIGNERDEAQKTLLESYMILTSELKTRLLRIQDEKDTLIQIHRQELSDVRNSWARSQLRVEQSKQTIRTLTKERDELKEGFEVLLQNVEVCNNFSSWPFPRIHLSSVLPEPIAPMATTISTPSSGFENRTLIYRLTQERDEARSERDLLIKDSAAKFSMLEAQLALREAELLSLQNGNELNRAICSSTELSQIQPLRLSSDDAIRILQYNTTKNRTIQIDIKKLRERLDTVRAKPLEAGSSIPSSSPLSIPRNPPRSQSTPLDEFKAEIQKLASELDALQLERANLKKMIAAEGSETADGAANETTTKSPVLKPGHPQEVCENCARLREENLKLQERVSELQKLFFPSQTPSPSNQSAPSQTSSSPLPFAKPSPFSPQSTPPLFQSTPPPLQSTPHKPPQSPPPSDTEPAGPDNEGELSMELATPLPSTVVLPPSSSRNSSLPSPISLTSSKRSSSRSHDSHSSTRRSSPSASALLSPFATSTDPIDGVEMTSPAAVAAVGLLIDLDDAEGADADADIQPRSPVVLDLEEGERGRRLGDDRLLHSQFRLSELELAHEAHEVHEVEDNDATIRPGPSTSQLRPPSPRSSSSPRPRTPEQVVQRLDMKLEEAGEDVIDELRDMILELMPDLGRGEG